MNRLHLSLATVDGFLCRCAVALALIPASIVPAQTPQGAEFTYQGVLKNSGAPYNGTADFTFMLFNSAGGATQIGSTLAANAVTVTDGMFTASLDFGMLAFNGEERWLEVAVHTPSNGGAGPFTPLTPRQQLASAPYAAYALNVANPSPFVSNSGNAVFTGGNVGIGTTNPTSALHLANSSSEIALKMRATGSWVAELRQTNASLLSLVNGGSERLSIDSVGRVGINTTAPDSNSRLHILESSTARPLTILADHTAATGTNYGLVGRSASNSGRGVFGHATAATGDTRGVMGQVESDSGDALVGIATALSGDARGAYVEARSPDGIAINAFNSATTGAAYAGFFKTTSVSGRAIYAGADNFSGSGVGVYAVSNASNGTGVFGQVLDSTGTTYGVYGNSASANGHGVRGAATATIGLTWGGWFTSNSRTGTGIEGSCLDSSTGFGGVGVKGFSNNSLGVGVVGRSFHSTGATKGVHGIVDSVNGHAAYFEGGRSYFEGNIGIGTTNPSEMLHLFSDGSAVIRIEADADNSIESHQPRIEMSQDGGVVTGGIGFYDSNNAMSLRTFDSGAGTPAILLEPEGSVTIGALNTTLGKFVVNQTADTQNGGVTVLNTTGGRTARLWVDGANTAHLDSGTGNGPLAINSGAGNVGIGISLPVFLLHVNGTAAKPGGGSWTVASDARLKKNVAPLQNALDRLLSLQGVTFEYIHPESINEMPGERIGFIAQEVERVLPDWVEDASDGYKRLTIRGFEALTVEALRELQTAHDAEVARREDAIMALRADNDELRAEVDELREVVRELVNRDSN